jgi:hypothetical protein
MYSRAEERYRAELAAAQQLLHEQQNATPTAPAEITPIVTVTPPTATEPVIVPLPAAPAAVPTPPVISTPVVSAAPPRPRPKRRRAQPPVSMVAACGALAVAATLGIILTLSPVEKSEPPAVVEAAAPPVTKAAPSPVSASPRVEAPREAPRETPAPREAPAAAAVATSPAIVRASSVGTSGLATSPVARPRANEGSLRITSTPAGARVTINGIGWGQTPVTIGHLPLGAKTVRITRDGYAAQERSVLISGEQPSQAVNATLQKR